MNLDQWISMIIYHEEWALINYRSMVMINDQLVTDRWSFIIKNRITLVTLIIDLQSWDA